MQSNKLNVLLQQSILTSEPLINPHLVLPPKGSLEDRVAIYANGFYARIAEALQSDYTTLASILGQNQFFKMCAHYIDSYPSYTYSLNFIGKDLPYFLKKTRPYLKKPYLAEIALFEWAESLAVIASDA